MYKHITLFIVLIISLLTMSCSTIQNIVEREHYIDTLHIELELINKYSIYFSELSSYQQELMNEPEIYKSSSEYLSYLQRKEEIRKIIEERLKETNEDLTHQVCPVIILLYREELINTRSLL